MGHTKSRIWTSTFDIPCSVFDIQILFALWFPVVLIIPLLLFWFPVRLSSPSFLLFEPSASSFRPKADSKYSRRPKSEQS